MVENGVREEVEDLKRSISYWKNDLEENKKWMNDTEKAIFNLEEKKKRIIVEIIKHGEEIIKRKEARLKELMK